MTELTPQLNLNNPMHMQKKSWALDKVQEEKENLRKDSKYTI